MAESEMMLSATFVIVDDHPLFRGAMRQALGGTLEINQANLTEVTILEADGFAQMQAHLKDHDEIDLIILDLTMPGVSGFSGLMALRAEHASIPVVIISAHDEPSTIRRALDLGASGFVPKSASIETIRTAISSILSGNIWRPDDIELPHEQDPEIADLVERLATLTPQQSRVLSMITKGLLNKQIAYELSVSEATVKAHVSAILQKLNVDSRTQAVVQLAKIKVFPLQ